MILVLTYSDELKYGDYVFPSWSITLGWCLNMCFILPIPVVILYACIRYFYSRSSLKQGRSFLCLPNIKKRHIKQQTENGIGFNMSSSAPVSDV